MADEVLKKIQEAEKEADEIIFSANESAKKIHKLMVFGNTTGLLHFLEVLEPLLE